MCGYEGFFGVGFIVVCRYSSVCKQIKVHTVAEGRLSSPKHVEQLLEEK